VIRRRFGSIVAPLGVLSLLLLASSPSLAKKAPKGDAKASSKQTGASKQAGPSPYLTCSPTEVKANEALSWGTTLRFYNSLSTGVYTDSVRLRYEDRDTGETRVERTRDVSMPGMASAFGSVSAGDSVGFSFSAPATFETGRVTIRVYCHSGDGNVYSPSTSFTVLPGPVSDEHPSEFLTVDGRKVETVFFRSAKGDGSPGILLIHGHGSQARSLLGTALQLASRGFHVMLVSMPGYGLSEGPPDLSGPRTIAAASAAFDKLKRTPGVDSTHVGAWGISRGAGVVATLAARRNDLGCAIDQSGIYDLQATYRGTKLPGFRETIVAEAGQDSAAWKERSPIYRASSTHAPTLVLHGEMDPNVPADQARAYAATLKAAGVATDSSIFPNAGHELSAGLVTRPVLIFLEATLHH
jgi:dipeptidyl aminopeptidase/acylaminoacyl peptidase